MHSFLNVFPVPLIDSWVLNAQRYHKAQTRGTVYSISHLIHCAPSPPPKFLGMYLDGPHLCTTQLFNVWYLPMQ